MWPVACLRRRRWAARNAHRPYMAPPCDVMVTHIKLSGPLLAVLLGFVTLAAVTVQLVPPIAKSPLVTLWVARLDMVLHRVTALGPMFKAPTPNLPEQITPLLIQQPDVLGTRATPPVRSLLA